MNKIYTDSYGYTLGHLPVSGSTTVRILREDLPQVRRTLTDIVNGPSDHEVAVFTDNYSRRLTARITAEGKIGLKVYGSPMDRRPTGTDLTPDGVRELTRVLAEMASGNSAPRTVAAVHAFRVENNQSTLLRVDGPGTHHHRHVTVPDRVRSNVCSLLNDYADEAEKIETRPAAPVLDTDKLQSRIKQAADALAELARTLRESPLARAGAGRAEPSPGETFLPLDLKEYRYLAQQFVFLGMSDENAERLARRFLRKHRIMLAGMFAEKLKDSTEYPTEYREMVIGFLTGKIDWS